MNTSNFNITFFFSILIIPIVIPFFPVLIDELDLPYIYIRKHKTRLNRTKQNQIFSTRQGF